MLGDAIGLDVGVRRRKHILEQTLVLQVHALPNNAKEQD
jgi:hypothetical protein